MKPFWKGVFSEADGTPSFSRVATAVLVVCAVAWVTQIVKATHGLPELGGLSLFITVLYATNRATNAFGTKPPDPPPAA
jgi:hypothetical protein